MTIPLNNILVYHEGLRNPDQIPGMVQHVRAGGRWDKSPIMIHVVEFEDGQLMLHDGHHRAVATYLAGREFLHPEECVKNNFKYEDYLKVNWDNFYVTPHDPRTEVLCADFHWHKRWVKMKLKDNGQDAAEDYILRHKKDYCRLRSMRFLPELAERFRSLISDQNSPIAV